MMESRTDLDSLWGKVVDQVKQKVIHPTLWRTLETAVPVVVENGEFVVGFAPGTYHMSGHMTGSEHKNAIESALREFSGSSLSLRVIEGTTVEDWDSAKAKDQRLQAIKDAAYKKREAETAVTKSWDGLLEVVGRRYASMAFRTMPQFRARYIEEVLGLISETMDVLMPEGKGDELAERSLARVLERVGTLAEVPPAIIALELKRLRGE